jgi:hypothetical protein
MEDLLAADLTEEEKQFLSEGSGVSGCVKLLTNRCIKNIEVNKRPFHLVDVARKKYLLRTGGDWVLDIGGNKILEGVADKLKNYWLIRQANDDPGLAFEKNQKVTEYFMNSQKVFNYLNEKIILKNTVSNFKKYNKVNAKQLTN